MYEEGQLGLIVHLLEKEEPKQRTEEWSRVVARDGMRLAGAATYKIGPDLIYDTSVRETLQNIEQAQGEILFSPLRYKASTLELNLEQHRLPEGQLLEHARSATQIRAGFRQRVEELKNAREGQRADEQEPRGEELEAVARRGN